MQTPDCAAVPEANLSSRQMMWLGAEITIGSLAAPGRRVGRVTSSTPPTVQVAPTGADGLRHPPCRQYFRGRPIGRDRAGRYRIESSAPQIVLTLSMRKGILQIGRANDNRKGERQVMKPEDNRNGPASDAKPESDPLDQEVCQCFHVTRRKIESWLRHNRPRRAGQLADCFSAGTGCGWCRPFLQALFEAWEGDRAAPEAQSQLAGLQLPSAAECQQSRADFRKRQATALENGDERD